MKKYLVILAAAVLALSSCEKMELKKNKSYTSAYVDGVTYKSRVMNDWSYKVTGSDHLFESEDGSFHIEVNLTMTSEKGSKIDLNLRVKENEDLVVGKVYEFPSDPFDLKSYSTAKITINEEGVLRYYYAQEGTFVIDDIGGLNDETSTKVINGSFAFSAQEEFSGNRIEVTEGRFHRAFFIGKGGAVTRNWW